MAHALHKEAVPGRKLVVLKTVVIALFVTLIAPACIVGEPPLFESADAGADDQAEPPSVPDAAVTATFGVLLSPRHGEVVDEPTGGATFDFRGFHDQPGYQIEIQTLADPRDLGSWTTIATATSDDSPDTEGGADAPYAWATTAAPGDDLFPEGGLVRFRAVGEDGGVLASFFHDSDECLEDSGAGSWKARAAACGGVMPYLAVVSPSPAPIPRRVDEDDIDDRDRPLFLIEKGIGSAAETRAYYETIDAPATVAEFRDRYNLDDPSAPSATFYNAGDLAAGREIRCATFDAARGVGVACYSSNYGEFGGDADEALELAIAGTESGVSQGAFATVSMVYQPPITAPNSVQFIVYGPDGTLLDEAALDQFGDNDSIPHNCLNCHGSDSSYDPATNSVTKARFLPFDPAQFEFANEPGYRLDDQQEQLRRLNQLILAAGPTLGVREYVEGMYGGRIAQAGTEIDLEYVPEGWQQSPRDRAVYRNVIEPYCRACHATREEVPGEREILDFTTAQSLRAASAKIGEVVCGPSGEPGAHSMPNAEAVLRRFWASPARAYLAEMTHMTGRCEP